MCGIAGYASADPRAAADYPRLLDGMAATLIHRGPDDGGRWAGDGAGLAVRRLSIIDLEGGHQPLSNEAGTIWIAMNGEIFNHLELRRVLEAAGHRFKTRADTEAVVHAYEEWGTDCVTRLNGQFAIAIWDGRRRRLFVARDRVGIKPLYYRHAGRELWFGSELKALLSLPFVERRVDREALRHYLLLEYVPSPLSIIEGIRKLPPGHWMLWNGGDGSLRTTQYWDVDLGAGEQAGKEPSDEQRAHEVLTRLESAVRMEMLADVPVGVFLSGGIDSSAVAAMMVRASPGKVKSFSVGFTDRSFDESTHARDVASHLGTTHHELILEPSMLPGVLPTLQDALDEPFADPSVIPTYLLARFAREHVKVALGGDGGDELFAGYPTMQAHRLATTYRLMPRLLRSAIAAGVRRLPVSHDNFSLDFKAKRFVDGVQYSTGERHLRWMGAFDDGRLGGLLGDGVHDLGTSSEIAARYAGGMAGGHPLKEALYLDMKLYLEGDILTKLDRATMLASLEGRVPLLNVDFVDYVAGLPIEAKLRGGTSKYIFKRALRGVLPPAILNRPKKGFGIPVARWLRGPLKAQLLDELDTTRLQRDGFFRPEAVAALIDEHMRGRRDHRKPLWTLFMFQRWVDHYLRDQTAVRKAA